VRSGAHRREATDSVMERNRLDAAPSTATIMGHPIHPMLVPFPLAFLVGVLLTDLAYWGTDDAFWARASLWLVGAGVVAGAVASIAGMVDFFTIQRAREHAMGWVHFLGNATALALSLVNWLLRVDDPATAVLPWGLVLSLVVAGILAVTGWAGGELTYRHRIGVMRGH
jgi:uncharacterized membrane protein